MVRKTKGVIRREDYVIAMRNNYNKEFISMFIYLSLFSATPIQLTLAT